MKDLLLITPPFTQLNTPYPATAYLKGFLNTKSISSFQVDLGIEVILALFERSKFAYLFESAKENNTIQTENAERIYTLREAYLTPLNEVIRFLQGENPTLARQICAGNFLPQASRFEQLDDLEFAFGMMGMQDKAKHLATLYLEDLSDFIIECIDDNFGFSRYAERMGQSANSFDELHDLLQTAPTFIDEITLSLLEQKINETQPKLICFSVPFPGNLYSAFRCAQFIKSNYPDIKIAMGGGFPNTELRSVTDTRVFDYFDFITLDDGELPIELLFQHIEDLSFFELKRTLHLKDDKVYYNNTSDKADYKQIDLGTPDYSDLRLNKYISVIEIANPMHSLWSDGRWNKLTMAHGCYWGKCTFCDISLDYIKIYEPIAAKILVDRMEELIKQTNESGFHFVDEAAPPALMKALALEIIRRKLTVTWWANIRFEKNFTQDLCLLLKASGCIAVSGGLEVASDRLLALIDKGVSVEQVAKVTRNFTNADIMVHAYLMYGYPTQNEQETIDSLEMVRQLFEAGIIQSGFWHQFALTAHSPIGLNPENYNLKPNLKEITFANNDIDFVDNTGIDHSKYSFGLKKSLYNYMHDIGYDIPLKDWFDFKTPRTKISPDYINNCLVTSEHFNIKANNKIIWLGTTPIHNEFTKSKKGNTWTMLQLIFHTPEMVKEIILEQKEGLWFLDLLPQLSPENVKQLTFNQIKLNFEEQFENFELFWYSKPIQQLKSIGLIVI
ncbi:B12-binding domain-containing radical SAM protein [Crocinitomix catalasitica]|uniref:B12-binding domain-containing radical SAM protein n=1 Tax=Crocinitomix catalasitica TaxID=184607 RepID=UPI000489B2C3|nr:radical SAM protein [Crocinitomix catalasitica]